MMSAGTGMMSASAGESGGDDNSDGKKGGGKRELSTSKRAAQNRAAQVCCLIRFVFDATKWFMRFKEESTFAVWRIWVTNALLTPPIAGFQTKKRRTHQAIRGTSQRLQPA
jgi:hypothetical protein